MSDALTNIFKKRCPRCRQGKLYKNPNPFDLKEMLIMNPKCSVCEQDFVIEPGFYFGATYISYAFNIALIVPLFLLFHFVLQLPFEYFIVALIIVIPLANPWIVRVSRAAFLSLYVKYDKEAAKNLKS